ncbi:MAG: V-type ATP synthase subunit A, partial [Candidatus Micrarchaeota archaeon]
RRHYPAINWLKSYSLYLDNLESWYGKNVSSDFFGLRSKAMALLQKEAELQAIVQLIGSDALPDKERLVLEVTKMLREDFLQQNSYDEVDVYTTLKKQHGMLKVILHFYDKALAALTAEMPYEKIANAKEKQQIALMKRQEEGEALRSISEIIKSIDSTFKK